MGIISTEVAQFLEAPLSTLASGCSREGIPSCSRVLGIRCESDGTHVTLWLHEETSRDLMADLAATGVLAVVRVHPLDNRSIQLKGRAVSVKPVDESEKPQVAAKVSEFVDACEQMGIRRAITERIAYWPAVAVTLEVAQLFDQTPGPGAGGHVGGVPAR
jgi:hypothetical protein